MDKVKISILEDGTIRMDTDRISQPNHGNCEMLIREMIKLSGGKAERKHKHGGNAHTHSHGEHEHQHG